MQKKVKKQDVSKVKKISHLLFFSKKDVIFAAT